MAAPVTITLWAYFPDNIKPQRNEDGSMTFYQTKTEARQAAPGGVCACKIRPVIVARPNVFLQDCVNEIAKEPITCD